MTELQNRIPSNVVGLMIATVLMAGGLWVLFRPEQAARHQFEADELASMTKSEKVRAMRIIGAVLLLTGGLAFSVVLASTLRGE
jgi:hypothetical protein